jgi:hypothetical protein
MSIDDDVLTPPASSAELEWWDGRRRHMERATNAVRFCVTTGLFAGYVVLAHPHLWHRVLAHPVFPVAVAGIFGAIFTLLTPTGSALSWNSRMTAAIRERRMREALLAPRATPPEPAPPRRSRP